MVKAPITIIQMFGKQEKGFTKKQIAHCAQEKMVVIVIGRFVAWENNKRLKNQENGFSNCAPN